MANSFIIADPDHLDENPQPLRVYARLDHLEMSVDGVAAIAYFDAIDAAWLDRLEDSEPNFTALDEAQLFIYEMRASDGWPGFLGLSEDGPEEQRWFEFTFSDTQEGVPAVQYGNLFAADGVIRFIIDDQAPPEPVLTRLLSITSLDILPDSPVGLLADVIFGRVSPQVWSDLNGVAVLDVGQGNCNALLWETLPVLYFDFGGSINANLRSFPLCKFEFCLAGDPAIVLSHWDWDHWSSVGRDQRAFLIPWVVPRQKLGPTQAACASQLAQNGNLFIWPNTLQNLTVGQVKIEKCTGRASVNNDSGLALFLERHDALGQKRILLAADAQYGVIPSAFSSELLALVASHHGGRLNSATVPQPVVDSHRLCYSYGDGNSHRHPLPQSVLHHTNGGWINVTGTGAGHGSARGHVGLYWQTPHPRRAIGCPHHQPHFPITK